MRLAVVIGLVSFTCLAQVKVVRDQSEKGDQRRTILAIPASGAYQVRPELKVECSHKEEIVQFVVEETDEFAVILEAGPFESANLGVKFDDGQSARHAWTEQADHRSYRYNGHPEPNRDLSSDAQKLLEDLRVQTDTLKFLGSILSAKTVQIEGHRFDAGELRKEFDKYPECRAYYRIVR